MAVTAPGQPDVTLIFAAGLPDSRRHRALATSEGRSLVGASFMTFSTRNRLPSTSWSVHEVERPALVRLRDHRQRRPLYQRWVLAHSR
jgi:hypothetical protein